MSLRWERHYPLALGTLTGIACFVAHASFGWQPPKALKDLFPAVLNVAAIAGGFLAVAQSLLFAIQDKPVIARLKDVKLGDANYFMQVVTYLMSAIHHSLALSVASAAILLIDWDPPFPLWRVGILSAWVGLATTSACAYFRIVHILGKLLRD